MFIFYIISANSQAGENLQTLDIPAVVPDRTNSGPALISAREYRQNRALWQGHGIKDYYVKIAYHVFSPRNGIYEITVENGRITGCLFNRKKLDLALNRDFIRTLIFKEIFDRVESISQTGEVEERLFTVSYHARYGFVSNLARLPGSGGSSTAPKTYRYQILEFKRLKNN